MISFKMPADEQQILSDYDYVSSQNSEFYFRYNGKLNVLR